MTARRPDGFSVHDDGPGFPPGLADHAFERFARGDASRTRGDARAAPASAWRWSQAIVTAHGGRVSLRSRPGSTEVTVTLPALTGFAVAPVVRRQGLIDGAQADQGGLPVDGDMVGA